MARPTSHALDVSPWQTLNAYWAQPNPLLKTNSKRGSKPKPQTFLHSHVISAMDAGKKKKKNTNENMMVLKQDQAHFFLPPKQMFVFERWILGFPSTLAETLAKHCMFPSRALINRPGVTWQTLKGLERVTQSCTCLSFLFFFFGLPRLGSQLFKCRWLTVNTVGCFNFV